MNKITIIGSGSVGATIGYTLTVMGMASEIVMIDINNNKALGEALDIRQGTPFCSPCSIYAGSYADSKDSDIVIITSGVARKPGQSRLDLAQTNVNIIKSIIPEITRYAPDAVYLIVSNPVDILTYTFCKCSGLPESRIIGSGTILDTARLRARLAEYYSINQLNVHAYVLGEHGDSSFVAWSTADITGIPLNDYDAALTNKAVLPITPYTHEEVEEYVRKSGGKIIAGKGATFYGIAASVCHIVKSIYSGADTVMTLSTLLDGEYGLSDVCLSTLCILGNNGIQTTLTPKMSEDELEKLKHSAEVLKGVIAQLAI